MEILFQHLNFLVEIDKLNSKFHVEMQEPEMAKNNFKEK